MPSDALKTGLGAVAGAGVSTALFTALPIGKILTGSTGLSFGYPIVVFGMVSLFALIAALFVTPIAQNQRWMVVIGIGAFVIISLAGTGVIFYEELRAPRVTLVEHFEPPLTDFHDPDNIQPVRLGLYYKLPVPAGTVVKEIPFENGTLTVKSGDTVEFSLAGFSDLEGKYQKNFNRLDYLQSMMSLVCARQKPSTNEVCNTLNDVRISLR